MQFGVGNIAGLAYGIYDSAFGVTLAERGRRDELGTSRGPARQNALVIVGPGVRGFLRWAACDSMIARDR
jgi:hypothetical protein